MTTTAVTTNAVAPRIGGGLILTATCAAPLAAPLVQVTNTVSVRIGRGIVLTSSTPA